MTNYGVCIWDDWDQAVFQRTDLLSKNARLFADGLNRASSFSKPREYPI